MPDKLPSKPFAGRSCFWSYGLRLLQREENRLLIYLIQSELYLVSFSSLNVFVLIAIGIEVPDFGFCILSDDPFKKLQPSLQRRILYIRIKPCRRFHDRFFVAEGFKRISPMIVANSAVAPTAKWQMMVR